MGRRIINLLSRHRQNDRQNYVQYHENIQNKKV